MRFLILAAILLAAPVHLARAQPAGAPPFRVMMCELVDESGTGWVPDFLMFTHQDQGPNAGRIEVFDPILRDLVGRPIKAVITNQDRRSLTFGWALAKVTNLSGQRTERLDYRLTVRISDGSAEMQATAAGYENTMLGRGRCLMPDR